VGFSLESPADRTIVQVRLWNPQLTVTTPRKPFEEITDMSDAERESWLFPFVVKLADASKNETEKP
jgi:hypothetical protein